MRRSIKASDIMHRHSAFSKMRSKMRHAVEKSRKHTKYSELQPDDKSREDCCKRMSLQGDSRGLPVTQRLFTGYLVTLVHC